MFSWAGRWLLFSWDLISPNLHCLCASGHLLCSSVFHTSLPGHWGIISWELVSLMWVPCLFQVARLYLDPDGGRILSWTVNSTKFFSFLYFSSTCILLFHSLWRRSDIKTWFELLFSPPYMTELFWNFCLLHNCLAHICKDLLLRLHCTVEWLATFCLSLSLMPNTIHIDWWDILIR